jgi:hypothetical protein
MRCYPQGRKSAWSLQSLRGYFVLDVSVLQFAFRGIVGCLTGGATKWERSVHAPN